MANIVMVASFPQTLVQCNAFLVYSKGKRKTKGKFGICGKPQGKRLIH